MNNFDHGDSSPDPSSQASFTVRCIATGLFTGYSPWASGTIGTLIGALCFFIPGFWNVEVLLPVVIAGLIAGIYTSAKIAEVEGHKLTESARRAKERFQPGGHSAPDPSIVVIDEIVGMWITMLAIHPSVISLVIGFVAFRVFDIIKPYPARQTEQFGSGIGIMLDDVVAAIYANITTRVIVAILSYFHPSLF